MTPREAEHTVREVTYTVSDQRIIRLHTESIRRNGALPRTVDYRHGVLTRLARALPVDLLDATREHLLDWRAGLDDLAPNTIGSYVSSVRSFYRWCVDEGHLETDPALRLPRPKPRRYKPRPVPHDDLVTALACAPEPIRTWVLLARLLGLRTAEIAAMRRQDVVYIGGKRQPFLDGIGKGNEPFRMPIDSVLMDALRPHLVGGPGPMWRTKGGRRTTPRDVSRQIAAFFTRIGMPYTAHQLRHSFGMGLYGQSHDALLVKQGMRHRRLDTVSTYVETTSAATAAAMEREAARFVERRSRRPRSGTRAGGRAA